MAGTCWTIFSTGLYCRGETVAGEQLVHQRMNESKYNLDLCSASSGFHLMRCYIINQSIYHSSPHAVSTDKVISCHGYARETFHVCQMGTRCDVLKKIKKHPADLHIHSYRPLLQIWSSLQPNELSYLGNPLLKRNGNHGLRAHT